VEARIFYQKVKEQANLPDDLATRKAVKAVFATLHWRLPEGEADDIAATLPPQLQKVWRGNLGMRLSKSLGRVDRLNKAQFLTRVRNMCRLQTNEEAGKLTSAVIHVLKEAVPSGEIKDMLAQLPGDLRRLVVAA
jgi:uncharacterized protein (DUF2267 family)